MGWSGSLTASSAVGSKITFTPDTSAEGGYTVSAFTAPKKGIYRFQLYGSGGTNGSTKTDYTGAFTEANLPGGSGGYTDGYLLLEKNQTVYVGAGGTCSAAFVAGAYGASLAAISSGNVQFVAGAGGAAGRCEKGSDYIQYGTGGNGGGASGSSGSTGGSGGTQSAGGSPGGAYKDGKGYSGSYGTGGATGYAYDSVHGVRAWGGRGGDGYYGGGSGYGVASHNSGTDATSSYAFGGGGGSGYVKTARFTHIGKTYTSATTQGSGMAANTRGKVEVTYYARALLPVFFDGVQLEKLFFNGVDTEGLTYNGTELYMRRLARRWKECLNFMAGRSGCPVATRGLSRFVSAA